MVSVLYVDQKDVLFGKYGKMRNSSDAVKAQVVNNLVVDTEVGHTLDKKEEIDRRVFDT